jgi:hypothetical protein
VLNAGLSLVAKIQCTKIGIFFYFLFLFCSLGADVYTRNLDVVRSSRDEIRKFAEDVKAIGVQYIGLCCGAYPSLIREVAEVYGKNPPASKYAMDLTKGPYTLGANPTAEMLKLRKYKTGK